MDFETILEEFHVPSDASGRGKNREGWINFQCPWCGRDPYMGYCVSSRALSCWNCGRQPLGETIQLLTGLTMPEVWKLVGQIPRPDYIPKQLRPRGKLELPSGLVTLSKCKPVLQYLEGRKFDVKKLETIWNIQAINFLGGVLAWRVFIPVYELGEVVTWQTRRITNVEPRYHAAKPSQSVVPIEETLYGIDFCRNSVILVEGCPDVWAIGPGAVDAFGTRIGSSQFDRLAKFPLRVVCFNTSVPGKDESAAEYRAVQLCRRLSVFDGVTKRVQLESGNDAASADPTEIEELRRRYLR